MIVGMIIGAWIMVSLSLAVYGVFYSDENDYSPVFIYPFELRIHFSDGDKYRLIIDVEKWLYYIGISI